MGKSSPPRKLRLRPLSLRGGRRQSKSQKSMVQWTNAQFPVEQGMKSHTVEVYSNEAFTLIQSVSLIILQSKLCALLC